MEREGRCGLRPVRSELSAGPGCATILAARRPSAGNHLSAGPLWSLWHAGSCCRGPGRTPGRRWWLRAAPLRTTRFAGANAGVVVEASTRGPVHQGFGLDSGRSRAGPPLRCAARRRRPRRRGAYRRCRAAEFGPRSFVPCPRLSNCVSVGLLWPRDWFLHSLEPSFRPSFGGRLLSLRAPIS